VLQVARTTFSKKAAMNTDALHNTPKNLSKMPGLLFGSWSLFEFISDCILLSL